MVDHELPEQLQPACRRSYAGLLLELAVRGRLEVLARVDVAAGQAPLLRVDARELVALLQQDPAAAIDQDDPGEAPRVWSGIPDRVAVGSDVVVLRKGCDALVKMFKG